MRSEIINQCNIFYKLCNEKLNKTLIFNFKNYKIFLVDGEKIRDNIFIDFVEGGNPARYSFIPKNEIWIEYIFSKEDIAATILHEYLECNYMIHKNMNCQ